MKTLLTLTFLVFACSAVSAQSRGDIYVNSNERINNPQSNTTQERAREKAGAVEFPAGPVPPGRSVPSNYRLFVTNFLVSNDSDKQIREIKWTATLINRDTQETIGTYPLQTRKKIGAHKSAKLKEKLAIPLKKLRGPVVSATQPTDPTKPVPVDEKYAIVEIVYADKSVSRP